MSTTDCCPPAGSKLPIPESVEEQNELLASLSKAMGHPARVAIIRLLKQKEQCVCGDIVDELPLAQSTVSQHLKVLKKAGLIRGEVDGPRICYCLEPAQLGLFQRLTDGL